MINALRSANRKDRAESQDKPKSRHAPGRRETTDARSHRGPEYLSERSRLPPTDFSRTLQEPHLRLCAKRLTGRVAVARIVNPCELAKRSKENCGIAGNRQPHRQGNVKLQIRLGDRQERAARFMAGLVVALLVMPFVRLRLLACGGMIVLTNSVAIVGLVGLVIVGLVVLTSRPFNHGGVGMTEFAAVRMVRATPQHGVHQHGGHRQEGRDAVNHDWSAGQLNGSGLAALFIYRIRVLASTLNRICEQPQLAFQLNIHTQVGAQKSTK